MENLSVYADNFGFIAGQLSLDFVNTQQDQHDDPANEKLTHYTDLVAWALLAGTLDEPLAAQLLSAAEQQPEQAARVLQRARELREALYRTLMADRLARRPAQADLDLLNAELAGAMVHRRLVHSEPAFTWGWDPDPGALDRPLWAVAQSAADLLTSSQQERLGVCSGDTCGWLFLDTSKNHSRRWCSMGDCGNVAKVRRHREKLAGKERGE